MRRILWALFGNDLDGVDANGPQSINWRPDLPIGSWRRRVLWWLRNPFHNLLWHVLGLVDERTQLLRYEWYRMTLTGGNPHANWAEPPKRWHVCYITRDKRLTIPRPFVSYAGSHVEWYIGWRERGNLGIAVRKAQR